MGRPTAGMVRSGSANQLMDELLCMEFPIHKTRPVTRIPTAIFIPEIEVDDSTSTVGLFVNFMIAITAAAARRLPVNPIVIKRMIVGTSISVSDTDVMSADSPRMPEIRNRNMAQTAKNIKPKNDG